MVFILTRHLTLESLQSPPFKNSYYNSRGRGGSQGEQGALIKQKMSHSRPWNVTLHLLRGNQSFNTDRQSSRRRWEAAFPSVVPQNKHSVRLVFKYTVYIHYICSQIMPTIVFLPKFQKWQDTIVTDRQICSIRETAGVPRKAPQGSDLGDVQSEGLSSPKTKVLVCTQTSLGSSPGVHDMEPSHRVGGRWAHAAYDQQRGLSEC